MKQGLRVILDNYRKMFKEAVTDLKTKGRRCRQIPNLLTLTRLVAAPCFIIPAAISSNVFLIAFFTAIFSLTDALDGYIARKYHFTSELGKDLDAICDKIFAGTLLVAASIFNPLLILNLSLETVIATINVKRKVNGQKPFSLMIGKAKTCMLYPLLGISFLNHFIDIKPLFYLLFGGTTIMQSVTIKAYLDNYKKENTDADNFVRTPKKEITTDFDSSEEKAKQSEKTYENTNSNLERYRQIKELLEHEIQINEPEKKIDNNTQKSLR